MRKWNRVFMAGLALSLVPAVAGAQQTFFPRISNAIVTNAPYTADVTSTVTQMLADGTRIEQSVTGKVYRDSAGRMRREQQVLGLGALTPGTNPVPIVSITDPTTRTTYTIDDRAQTATKGAYASVLQWNIPVQWLTPSGRGVVNWIADPNDSLNAAVLRLNSSQAADIAALAANLDRLRAREAPLALELGAAAQGLRQGGGGRGGRTGGPATPGAPAPESLGSRQMEGVMANGTRVTQTIPTGQIGNDRPIVITDETWDSSDLQVIVYSKHHDPRSGDVEYRLRNISRNEPASTLFQVPAGYTMVDPLTPYGNAVGGRGGGGRGGAPVPPPAPRAPGQ